MGFYESSGFVGHGINQVGARDLSVPLRSAPGPVAGAAVIEIIAALPRVNLLVRMSGLEQAVLELTVSCKCEGVIESTHARRLLLAQTGIPMKLVTHPVPPYNYRSVNQQCRS